MRALKVFDPYQGCRFISFAYIWVLKEIKEHIMRSSKCLKIVTKREHFKLFFRANNLRGLDEVSYNRQADKLADELGVTRADVDDMVQRLRVRSSSLDMSMNSETEDSFYEVIPDHSLNPEEVLIKKDRNHQVKELIRDGLSTLTEIEKKVIQKRYFNEELLSYQKIGDELTVSKQRIYNVENIALKKLKMMMLGSIKLGELK
jgi:RNA polymerase sigma-32 factor